MSYQNTAMALYRYGRISAENKATLEGWFEQAIQDMASNSGQTVQSTSANGVQVSFQSNGMTTTDWFNALSLALQYLDSPPVSRIQAIVR